MAPFVLALTTSGRRHGVFDIGIAAGSVGENDTAVPTSVSYTHLDVYKRQHLRSSLSYPRQIPFVIQTPAIGPR